MRTSIAQTAEARPWWMFAVWLVALQGGLYLLAVPLDAAVGPGSAAVFWAATLLFLGYVFVDGARVGLARPWLWAGFVTFLPVIGGIVYARRRAGTRA
jgi:hypothetical protein